LQIGKKRKFYEKKRRNDPTWREGGEKVSDPGEVMAEDEWTSFLGTLKGPNGRVGRKSGDKYLPLPQVVTLRLAPPPRPN
jgi:hypothetical protein